MSVGVYQTISIVVSIIAAVLVYVYEIRMQNSRTITALIAGTFIGVVVQFVFIFARPWVVS